MSAVHGITLLKQRSPVRLDVPTAGASIFWYFQVNPVNILRQAAKQLFMALGDSRVLIKHAHVLVPSPNLLRLTQQWHLT